MEVKQPHARPRESVVMFQEFARFLELPSRATYLAARGAWLRLGVQPLHPAELTELAEWLSQGDATRVIAQAHGWHSRAALSPRVHFLTAAAHTLLGEQEQAELERWVFSTCLSGILATGDGSPKKPYSIAQISDEYDVLKLLGLTRQSQRLVQRGRRTCDVLACTDGSEIWFEVSELVQVPAEAVPLKSRPSKSRQAKNKVELNQAPAAVTRTRRQTSGRLRIAPR